MLLNNAGNFGLERKAHAMASSGCCRERALLLITSGIALLALASMRREGSLAVLVTARRKVTKCLTRISLKEKNLYLPLHHGEALHHGNIYITMGRPSAMVIHSAM